MALTSNNTATGSIFASFAAQFSVLVEKVRARRDYRRTVAELEALGRRELNDLGLSRGSIKSVAHKAVYGN